MSQNVEQRATANPEARARIETREGGQRIAVGYAAIFYREDEPGSVYRMYEDLHERIAAGAFDRALRESHDVRALANHDKNQLLGRTASGTCRLSVDAMGLRYEIDLPDTQAGRDIGTSIDRGDLDGSSFSFIPTRVSWIEEGPLMIRQVEDVDLYDVGPVTYPAYEGTSSGIRSEGSSQELREQADEIRDERRSVETTLRILDLEK